MTDRGWNGPKWSDEPSDASSNRVPSVQEALMNPPERPTFDEDAVQENLRENLHAIPNRVYGDEGTEGWGTAAEDATRNRVDTMSADWKDGYETGYAEGWLAASKGEPGPWT